MTPVLFGLLMGSWQGQGVRTDLQLNTTEVIQVRAQAVIENSGADLLSQNCLMDQTMSPPAVTSDIYRLVFDASSGLYHLVSQGQATSSRGILGVDGVFRTHSELKQPGLDLVLDSTLSFSADGKASHYEEKVSENGQLRTTMKVDYTKLGSEPVGFQCPF